MKKPIQITIDDGLLRRIDRDPEAKKNGRSAFIRKAVDEYLRRKRKESIDEAYERGYREHPPTEDEFGPWPNALVWPDE